MATITADKPLIIYTPTEVADILSVHPQTVYTLIREGRLKAVTLGRTHRITAAALTEFLAGE